MKAISQLIVSARYCSALGGLSSLNSIFMGLVFGLISLSASNIAIADEAVAKKNACFACHANDTKVLGPSFKEVAKRYSGQDNAAAKLAASIKAGGVGKWGTSAMPSQEQISQAEALAMANSILTMK
jgi:cytochrome c